MTSKLQEVISSENPNIKIKELQTLGDGSKVKEGHVLSLEEINDRHGFPTTVKISHKKFLNHQEIDGDRFLDDKPHPRQFFVGTILYQEELHRKMTWDELFLDLVFVAIIAALTLIFKDEGVNWETFEKFYLIYVPVFLSWQTITVYMNRFKQYVFWDKSILYLSMILVIGMGLNAENSFNEKVSENTSNIFIVTYLVFRAFYLGIYVYYSYKLPEFKRFILTVFVLPHFLSLLPWFSSVLIPHDDSNFGTVLRQKKSLWWSSYIADIFFTILSVYYTRIFRQKYQYRIALDFEHLVERMGLFIIITLGEIIVSILWSSRDPSFSTLYVDTILGLAIAISFQRLYFYLIDAYSGEFTHPIRQSFIKGILWLSLQLPFSAFIVAGGAAIGILIAYDPVTEGHPSWVAVGSIDESKLEKKYGFTNVSWLLCACYSAALALLVILGYLYKPMPGSIHGDEGGNGTRGGHEVIILKENPSNVEDYDNDEKDVETTEQPEEKEQTVSTRITHHPRHPSLQLPAWLDPQHHKSNNEEQKNGFFRNLTSKKMSYEVHDVSDSVHGENSEIRPRMPKWTRLTIRAMGAVIFLLVGIIVQTTNLSSSRETSGNITPRLGLSVASLLGILGTVCFVLVSIEEYGKLKIAVKKKLE